MCSSGQCLFLPRTELQQMDEVSTFAIFICEAATLVINGQVGYINRKIRSLQLYKYKLKTEHTPSFSLEEWAPPCAVAVSACSYRAPSYNRWMK
ncbi:hypothetical protein [Bacillus manliponensis]|uniref:hypothetical protein n=1 Tax=Bacillus manliponensis TaxID=574376 RepID=UPI0035147D58